MKKGFVAGLVIAISTVVIAGCSSNISGFNPSNDEGFNIMNSQGNDMENLGFPGMKGRYKQFAKDLNLSDSQKAQFKELKTQMKSNFKNKADNRKEMMTFVKSAFLSDKIDKEALKNKFLSLHTANDDKVNLAAANIIKAYNILTPDQRTKVEGKFKEMQDKMSQRIESNQVKGFPFHEKIIEKISSGLKLSDTQKVTIKEMFNSSQPNRKEMFDKAVTVKTSILAELKTGNPDVEKIKATLNSARTDMQGKLDTRLDKLVQIHDLLTPDQRQKLVSFLDKRHMQMMNKFKKHVKDEEI